MGRVVVEKTSEDGLPWYSVSCERCGEYLGALYARIWLREQADEYPCHVCEPRAVGAVVWDPDPADALDFDGTDDAALAAIDDNYAADLATSRRQRAPRYSENR